MHSNSSSMRSALQPSTSTSSSSSSLRQRQTGTAGAVVGSGAGSSTAAPAAAQPDTSFVSIVELRELCSKALSTIGYTKDEIAVLLEVGGSVLVWCVCMQPAHSPNCRIWYSFDHDVVLHHIET